MPYRHGIYISEEQTGIISPVSSIAGLTVAFGAAPINMGNAANVNVPILAYTYEDAVAALGFVPAKNGKFDFTLSEVIDCFFSKFSVGPLVLVNVLDPTSHKTSVAAETVALADGVGVIENTGAVKTTVVVKKSAATVTQAGNYELTFNEQGQLLINVIAGGALATEASVSVAYDYLDPSKVVAADIIGGIDANTGKRKGLELLDEVFPRFRFVPGTAIAPGFSHNTGVAQVLKSKVKNINNLFKAEAIIDLDTATVKKYQDVPAAKETAGLVDTHLIVGWGKPSLAGVQYHLSTELAALMQIVDADNGGEPFVSPSNKNLAMDSLVLSDGTPIWLSNDQAEYLNSNGIVTALNWSGGWKAWGNETSVFPSNSDVKDRFIPVRRMFNYIGNTLVTTFWSKLDFPLNKRQIETVQDSANDWLNGLVAQGILLGGRVEFLRSDNSDTALLSGSSKFRVFLAAPTPNGDIEFVIEYDTQYLATVFE